MRRALSFVLLFPGLAGCALTSVAGAVIETGATVAKTGVKAGGAVADGAIDVVDADGDEAPAGEESPPEE